MKIIFLLIYMCFVGCSGEDRKHTVLVDMKYDSMVKEFLNIYTIDISNSVYDGSFVSALYNTEKGYTYLVKFNKDKIHEINIIQGKAQIAQYSNGNIFVSLNSLDSHLGNLQNISPFEHSRMLIFDKSLKLIRTESSKFDYNLVKMLDFHTIGMYNGEFVKSYYMKDFSLDSNIITNQSAEFFFGIIEYYDISGIKQEIDLRDFDDFNSEVFSQVSFPFDNSPVINLINNNNSNFVDFHHVNNIEVVNHTLIISARNTSSIYFYDLVNKSIIGKLVGDSEFGASDYLYSGESFSQQHSSFINKRGNLVIFNNNSKVSDSTTMSSLLEIEINHISKEAEVVFRYEINQEQSSITGNVQELANGDYIIGTGIEDFGNINLNRKHIIRITSEGDIVSEVGIKHKEGDHVGIYKSFFIQN